MTWGSMEALSICNQNLLSVETDIAPVLEIMSSEKSSDRSGRKNCLLHRHISVETLRVSSFLKQDG